MTHQSTNSMPWKGGTSYGYVLKAAKSFGMSVDKCSRCGSKKIAYEQTPFKGGNIHIHHIDHNRTNNTRDNLVVLCDSCHQKEHYPEVKEALIAAPNSGRFKPGKPAWNKGKKMNYSKEALKRMSRKGVVLTEEHKIKISLGIRKHYEHI